MTEPLNISKLDACQRQLETAIDLYFHDGDPVSIHTLAMAAFEVGDRLAHKLDIEGFIREYVRPEYRDEIRDRMKEAGNFFKHGSTDPGAVLHFDPSQSEIWLLAATMTVWHLGVTTPLLMLFRGWAFSTFARNWVEWPIDDRLLLTPQLDRIARMTRTEFFAEQLSFATEAADIWTARNPPQVTPPAPTGSAPANRARRRRR
jgi:hypothetical protein